MTLGRAERRLLVLAAAPAAALIGLLLYTMLSRVGYPYDLEWMEGGLLGHAARLASGHGIYVAPSDEFIPYLYTPLYPSLIALFGGMFGVSYALARVLSILAVLGTLALLGIAVVQGGRSERPAAITGGVLAAGLYAATYPWVDGWFDLVRADSLFVVMIVGGLLGLRMWARHPGRGGRWRIAAMAYLLALAFFCKQTGVLFCALGGVLLLVMNWRRTPIYAAVAAVIGLGGAWLFQRATGGWFWTYVYQIHQTHDFNHDRFVSSFGKILGHFPTMTAAIALGLIATAAGALRQRRLPPGAAGLIYWTPVFAVACLVGALGWATQWAHFNAYLPAMATGALAAGAALPAIASSLGLGGGRRTLAAIGSVIVALGLAVDVGRSAWKPARFVPTADDVAAGDALIARLRAAPGDVFVPYHPWYPVMAGKPAHVHRMGLLDVGYKNKLPVSGLGEAFAAQRYALIVLDDRPLGPELAGLAAHYRMDDVLPASERPRIYSGAQISPRSLWVPNQPLELPPGAHVLHDFETGELPGWTIDGTAFGRRAVTGPLGKQGQVYRYGGRFYLSSFHGGDPATGVLSSPEFVVRGSRLTFRVSGGKDEAKLRVELVVAGQVEKSATAAGSERMAEVVWNLTPYEGKPARIRLVDQASGSWGHLNADEFWLWD